LALVPAVVRHVIWDQTQEYHSVIASECRPLDLELDLLPYLTQTNTILTQTVAIRLIQWWKPYSRILTNQLAVRGAYNARNNNNNQQQHDYYHPYESSSYNNNNNNNNNNTALLVQAKGLALKDVISFTLDDDDDDDNDDDNAIGKKITNDNKLTIALKDYLFYLDKDSPLAKHQHAQIKIMQQQQQQQQKSTTAPDGNKKKEEIIINAHSQNRVTDSCPRISGRNDFGRCQFFQYLVPTLTHGCMVSVHCT
jgi:hypothetical protein